MQGPFDWKRGFVGELTVRFFQVTLKYGNLGSLSFTNFNGHRKLKLLWVMKAPDHPFNCIFVLRR